MELLIRGGKPLTGEIQISGGKNAVLPILAATVMCRGVCRIRECPNLSDVDAAMEILAWLGADVSRQEDTITVDPTGIYRWDIPKDLMNKMRGSVFFIGPLMARFGRCCLSQPGGCSLGERPVDFHLLGLRKLGAEVSWGEGLCCSGDMTGALLILPYPSVGATENLVMAATGACGCTTIFNCAREPEISALCTFLRRCGARIQGDGTAVIRIWGGMLSGCEYTVIPDRMEAATYMCAAAATGGKITLKNINPEHLSRVSGVLQAAGCHIGITKHGLYIEGMPLHSPGRIITSPYPGFPTDAQAPVMAGLLKAKGQTLIRETVFSSRMHHVSGLLQMGADIRCQGNEALICGVNDLHAADTQMTDLRGGAALAIAALSAEGTSIITGLEHLLRGYDNFAGKLKALGAEVSIG